MFTFFLSTNTYSGMCALLVAGENLTAFDVCYVKASDKKAYQLASTMTSELTQLTVLALETIASGATGKFMIRGTVTNPSWSLTAGQVAIVPSTKGTLSAETDV